MRHILLFTVHIHCKLPNRLVFCGKITLFLLSLLKEILSLRLVFLRSLNAKKWGKTLVFPHTPLALLNVFVGLCPTPHLRNFFEKKFLRTLQKTFFRTSYCSLFTVHCKLPNRLVFCGKITLFLLSLLKEILSLRLVFLRSLNAKKWGKTLVFPHTPLALLNVFVGLCPTPHLRNFFEKKFLRTLQKTF